MADAAFMVEEVVDALPVMVAFIDKSFRHVYSNKPYKDWFPGVDGKTLKEVFGEAYDLRESFFHRALLGERVEFESRMKNPFKGGQDAVFNVELIPQRDGFFLCRYDVTPFIERCGLQASGPDIDDSEFRLLAENLPALAWIANADGFIFWYNRRWHEYCGSTPEEMSGWGWQAVHDPAILPAVMEEWTKALASGEPFEMTFPLRGADGIFRPFLTRAVPIKNPDGKVLRWLGKNTDISGQVEAEAQYRAIYDSAVDPIIVIDDTGIIQTANRAAAETFGYEISELSGQNIKMLVPTSIAGRHDDFLKAYRETGVRKVIDKINRVDAQRRDGSVFPIELGVTEWTTSRGRFFTGVMKDVTDREAYQKRLENLNEQLEQKVAERATELDLIFKMSNDILGICKPDGSFESVSPAFTTITGYPAEAFVGRQFMDFVHPDDKEKTLAIFGVLLAGTPVRGYENRYRCTDGSYKWLSWSVTPGGDGDGRRMFCVARDITEGRIRDEALRQSQKMEAIGQLTGGIAHDFNNLLMGITGSLDLINRKLPDGVREEVARYIDGAQGSATRAAALTHRLLAFSRRQPLAPTVVDINALVVGMQDLIQRTIGTEIEVVVKPTEVWPTKCDANQLESGLLNLFINARDAMPEGGTILVRTMNVSPDMCEERGIPPGEYTKIMVQDSGVGMNEDVKGRVFDPFFTTKPLGQGTGLGLSMLYGFMHQSGGHVRLQSETGKGTCVMLYLPRSQEDRVVVSPTPTMKQHPSGTNLHILVVEDEDVIRGLVHDVLEASNYTVDVTTQGSEALQIIADQDQQIDLMITDVGLPGLNGKLLAEMAREIRPHLKVLFITGFAAGVTLREELVLADSDLLLKPFTMEALQAKVTEMVHGSLVVEG